MAHDMPQPGIPESAPRASASVKGLPTPSEFGNSLAGLQGILRPKLLHHILALGVVVAGSVLGAVLINSYVWPDAATTPEVSGRASTEATAIATPFRTPSHSSERTRTAPRKLNSVDKQALAELEAEFASSTNGELPTQISEKVPSIREREVVQLPRSSQSPSRNLERKSEMPPAAGVSATATLAYWNAMNSVFEKEAAMRAAPLAGLTGANAADFQSRRLSAGKYAVSAMKNLDRAGVDPEVLSLADRISAWYSEGVKICERGKFLLEKADSRTRKGPEGKQWQDSDKAHQEAVSTINASGEQVRTRVQSKFGVTFPALK